MRAGPSKGPEHWAASMTERERLLRFRNQVWAKLWANGATWESSRHGRRKVQRYKDLLEAIDKELAELNR